MIEVQGLTKRYGERTAVDDLSFTVRPGIVTGFLGPNGAGKSTTMRMILGLDRPSAGTATVDGLPVGDHAAPITRIGALVDAKAAHARRSARDHLRAIAATSGITDRRVDDVIGIVGLESVATRPAGSFSLGMGQRLGIAAALLGDPGTVMLDEPVNGLDPEGILWIRGLLRDLAAEGRTVFVSSHLMSEMSMIAEHYVIIGRGRLIADVTAAELESRATRSFVRVRTPQAAALREALLAAGASVTTAADGTLEVAEVTAPAVGATAARIGAELHELTPVQPSLEDIFMDLTADAVEYHGDTDLRRAA